MTNSVGDEVVVLVAVLLLGLAMRWAFTSSRPRSPFAGTAQAADLGLLEIVTPGLTRSEAMTVRAALGEAGIRSSMSRQRDGTVDVLVFRADFDRARAVLDRG